MIKNWLTRYTLKYPRALTYMLQSSEYKTGEYLDWYKTERNFSNIEKRKKLVKTKKAMLILAVLWIMTFAILAVSVLLFSKGGVLGVFSGLVLLTLAPHVLAYGILVPLLLIKIFVQKPLEYLIINKAKKKISKHKAIKIAIAGSFGKTTMREILKTVIGEGKITKAPPENHNTLLGISRFIEKLDGKEEVLIFELGEYYPGDITELCKLTQPDIGVITGINEAHLKKFKTIDKTVKTIYELAEYLGDKSIYVNGENNLARSNAPANAQLYGRGGVGNWRVWNALVDLDGTSFILGNGKDELRLESKLLGMHQIGPLALACALSEKLGLSSEKIIAGIKNTKPFQHRLEPSTNADGVIMLDDSYNGNPDGVKAVIDFLSQIKGHRRFYVTPGLVEMGDRTYEVHKNIGKLLAEAKIENVVLVQNSVTPFIAEGLTENGFSGKLIWFPDGLSALGAIPSLTVSGDVVTIQNDWSDQYK